MLTTCPKCHHLFNQTDVDDGGGCPPKTKMKESTSPSTSPPHHRRAVDEHVTRQCCPSVMTIQVPVCAMTSWTGGSVILQKGKSRAKLRSPEPSPSTPLSFVLPTTPTVIMSSNSNQEQWNFTLTAKPAINSSSITDGPISSPQSPDDFQRLSSTIKSLTISGWYYEGLSWRESVALLMTTTHGTFLVRDSSDPRYLFSLSVQTERGPTSVRLHYSNGHFRLDAEPELAPAMPQFDCVVKLIEYYINVTKNSLEHRKKKLKSKDQVWIDSTGQMYSHILLSKPLVQKDKFPTLQHLARLNINRLIKNGCYVPTLTIPVSLQKYLIEYPFVC